MPFLLKPGSIVGEMQTKCAFQLKLYEVPLILFIVLLQTVEYNTTPAFLVD